MSSNINSEPRYATATQRLDLDRTRRIGQMIINESGELDESSMLLDLSRQSPTQLLDKYKRKLAKFETAPFDVAGSTLRFFPGGYTIWSGYPGTGKTTILRQLACHLLHRKTSIFFASLEEDPGDLLIRMAAVAFGVELPTIDQLTWFVDYYADQLRLWGVIGLAKHRDILSVIQKLAKSGVTHAVIDSLMCLDIPSDDIEAQRKFANLLNRVARTTGVHIHLVAHPRKVISSSQEPDLNDVAGSADLGRLADNVLFVRRGDASTIPHAPTPMKITVKKQRHGSGRLGDVTGYINKDLNQFKIDMWDIVPTRYLPDMAYQTPATEDFIETT